MTRKGKEGGVTGCRSESTHQRTKVDDDDRIRFSSFLSALDVPFFIIYVLETGVSICRSV